MTDPLNEAMEQIQFWTEQANQYEHKLLAAESAHRREIAELESILTARDEHIVSLAKEVERTQSLLDEAVSEVERLRNDK